MFILTLTMGDQDDECGDLLGVKVQETALAYGGAAWPGCSKTKTFLAMMAHTSLKERSSALCEDAPRLTARALAAIHVV